MAWREELTLGKAYIEELYIGTYPGSLLSGTELGFLDGVTAGTAAASKALVLGSSKEIAQITTLSATTVNVGADGGTAGTLTIWPTTNAKGQINIVAADNSGDDIITITNSNTSANITITLPTQTGTLVVDGQATLNVGADSGGILGTINLWPDTVDKGKLVITCADNSGDDVVTLTGPAATSGDITITLPDTAGYLVAGTAQISKAEVDVLDAVTPGTAASSKAVVLGGSGEIAQITTLSATTVNVGADGGTAGTLTVWPTTNAKGQLNITATDNNGDDVVTLTTGDASGGNITIKLPNIGGYLAVSTAQISVAEMDVLDAVTPGTAASSKALVLGGSGEIAQITTLSATTANVGADGGTAGTLTVWPTTNAKGQLNITATDNDGDDIVTLTTGDASAGNITVKLPNVAGYLAASTAQISVAEMDVLSGATAGTQVASKAVVADANINIGVVKATELHIGATGSEVQVNATAAEINYECDMSARFSSITGASQDVEITDSGKTFVLNKADGIAITLPAVATAAGFWCRFVVGTNCTSDATIVTDTSENKIHGVVVTGADGTATTGSNGTAGDTITFANGSDVVGDYVELFSDGVLWYAFCFAAAATGITITTAS